MAISLNVSLPVACKERVAIAAIIIALAACSREGSLKVSSHYFMGDVYKEDSILSAAVVLKNRGWKRLAITDVRPSCPCTRVDKTKMIINSMSSETISVNIDLNSLGAMDDIDETIGIKSGTADTFTQVHVIFNLKYRNN